MQIAGSVIASAKMEIDPQSLDSPDLPICWVSEDQGSNHGRSYECTFCKRGFSNAQALGGHMNVHRRDRAKLKNPSTNTPFPTKNYPSLSTNYLSDLESSEMDHKLKWPWILPPDDSADDGELRQLPLFVDMPAMENSCEDRQVSPMEGNYGDLALQVGTQLGEGKSKRGRDLELDLELRLGPEPHDGTVMPLVLK